MAEIHYQANGSIWLRNSSQGRDMGNRKRGRRKRTGSVPSSDFLYDGLCKPLLVCVCGFVVLMAGVGEGSPETYVKTYLKPSNDARNQVLVWMAS